MPEEYDQITHFVDRIERRTAHKQEEKLREEETRLKEVRAGIPDEAFNTNILDANLPEHIAFILQEAEIATLGDLVQQMRLNPDAVLALQGIGPKALQTIQETVDAVEVVVKSEPVEELEVVTAEAESLSVLEGVEPAAAETTPGIHGRDTCCGSGNRRAFTGRIVHLKTGNSGSGCDCRRRRESPSTAAPPPRRRKRRNMSR